jgi:transcriptional regulator with XRE-family HTH domain
MQAELMSTFGPRLERLLGELGVSQNELERRAKLGKGAVSNYITGRREQPRLNTMQRMAAALGVPVERLADDEPPDESAEHELPAHRRTESEEFPSLEEALILLEGKLDPRAQKLLLRKKTLENKDRSREWWLAQAKEVQAEVKAIDREWPELGPAPSAKPSTGRGKASG